MRAVQAAVRAPHVRAASVQAAHAAVLLRCRACHAAMHRACVSCMLRAPGAHATVHACLRAMLSCCSTVLLCCHACVPCCHACHDAMLPCLPCCRACCHAATLLCGPWCHAAVHAVLLCYHDAMCAGPPGVLLLGRMHSSKNATGCIAAHGGRTHARQHTRQQAQEHGRTGARMHGTDPPHVSVHSSPPALPAHTPAPPRQHGSVHACACVGLCPPERAACHCRYPSY